MRIYEALERHPRLKFIAAHGGGYHALRLPAAHHVGRLAAEARVRMPPLRRVLLHERRFRLRDVLHHTVRADREHRNRKARG